MGGRSETTVYLDTANWIDLAEGKASQELFEKAVGCGRIIPILSFIHVLEFAIAGTQVARYVDHVRTLGKVLWVKNLHAVVEAEARSEYERFVHLPVTPVSIFEERLVDVLRSSMSWSDKADVRSSSVEYAIEVLASSDTFRRFQNFKETVPDDQIKMRLARGRKRFSKSEPGLWTSADLPKVLKSAAGVFYKPEISQDFVESVDPSRCPVSSLRMAFFEGEVLTSDGSPSDFEDFYHMVGPAYCDVAFVDKRTQEKLRKAKVRTLPHKNSEFVDWLKSL